MPSWQTQRRPPLQLPGEGTGRRHFLRNGLLGAALLALGGGGWLATRRTRPLPLAAGPLQVFSPEEGAILLAIADRMIPVHGRFPRPAELGLPQRMDGVAAMADPVTQAELRRLVRLFESALSGLLLDGQPRLFTESSAAQQDRRLRAWARSRLAIRRTGYRALKRLVYGAYYTAPETWPAFGYPGPPLARAAPTPLPAASPAPVPDDAR